MLLSEKYYRPTYINVDLPAILENYQAVGRLHPNKKIMAVVKANGYGLGNVATTFYPWIYDFGYQGVFWLTLIMSVTSEFIYQMTKRCHRFLAPLSRLFYGGTIVPCIIFAFFSNKFYESMDIIFITLSIIIWIGSNYMFSKENNK